MTQQSIIKLPQGWASVPLGEIAVWGAGGTPKRSEPSYYDGDIPWVKTGDLGPRRLKHASEYIAEWSPPALTSYRVFQQCVFVL